MIGVSSEARAGAGVSTVIVFEECFVEGVFLVTVIFLVVDLVDVDFLAVELEDVFLVDLEVAEFFLVAVLAVGLVRGSAVFKEMEVFVAEFLERRGASPSIDLFLSIAYNYIMKAVKLTKKQLALLNFLQDFTEENGYSPSYREIQAGLGLSSVSAVAEHIDNLVSKGALRKVPGAARSLEVLDYKHEETVELFKVAMMGCSEEEKEILLKAGGILGLDLE